MDAIKLRIAAALSAALALAQPAFAQGDLEERVRALEKQLETQVEDAKAKDAATVGFKFKALMQLDGRFFADDEQTLTDTFVVRRIEPTFEFSVGKLAFLKIQPQFAGDTASTADVYGELRFHPAAGLRFGKFKTPLGLENLQGTTALMLVERGLPTELGAGRDIGLQLQGEVFAGTTTYQLAYVNGTTDGRDAASSDTDNRKEVAARVFFEPLKNGTGFLRGLGFGVGMTQGNKVGTIGSSATASTSTFNNTLPRYRSPGQSTIFAYRSASTPTVADTVLAAGEHARLSPQLYFYRGSFGLLAEQMSSEQEVSLNGVADTFEHTAWRAGASYLLTGEDASYKGSKPNAPYAAGGPGWGAFEIALHHGVLDVDDDAFPTYADPARSVSEATTDGVALNWYLTGNARITLDYEKTSFDGGAATGDRTDEKALFTRLQLSF